MLSRVDRKPEADYGPRMQCVVEDKRIAEVVAGSEAKASGLPVTVIKALRSKLRLVLAAPDVSTLQNWRSLRFFATDGFGEIQINEEWVMKVEIRPTGGDHEMRIIGLEACIGAVA